MSSPSKSISAQSHSGDANYNTIEMNIRHLLGKTLTIVDASITDKEQKKAAKDLLKDAFRDSLQTFQVNCFGNGLAQTTNLDLPVRTLA